MIATSKMTILVVALTVSGCIGPDQHVTNGRNCRCWSYSEINSNEIKPIHGICFREDHLAYKFTDDNFDSIRYIEDLVDDADPGGLQNVLFEWDVESRGRYFSLDDHRYKLIKITNDTIEYQLESGKIYLLVPSISTFPENWEVLNQLE